MEPHITISQQELERLIDERARAIAIEEATRIDKASMDAHTSGWTMASVGAAVFTAFCIWLKVNAPPF